ncbi:decaprenyl-diphosphate synthase subunit 1 isoform X1 [Corythoichthys intestinalis]|uniref:decaprenyl-diphosphate synthase subunit 1 isoform X1 n=1 Tax=Corythoichthys intestinalis TaxID=161448 RepID=UPI0025A543D4|nr:decaprenyl-diphosphate synthase subunit 1 isoform X1 [Corythoichthys intestinalis]
MAGPLWRQCQRWLVGRAAATLRRVARRDLPGSGAAAVAFAGPTAWKSRLANELVPALQLNQKMDQRSTGTSLSLARRKYPACSWRRIHSDAKPKDPFTLAQKDLSSLYDDIKKELFVSKEELKSLCDYYFDGKGKAIRPMIVVLMARALNIHSNQEGDLLPGQRAVAMISEMIHTASLVHDDVIDGSDERRGKRTINDVWGEKKAILAGDFILSAASMALARIGDITVVKVLAQVIEDLVRGEFMQLGSKENESERFKHYLDKTFKKTASLIANSCKAVCTFCLHRDRRRASFFRLPVLTALRPRQVSILVNSDPDVHEIAYQYGRNVGIAFQLVDDVLDFTAGASQLGKPSAADLKLGLATGPVLFACQQFPELHVMIMRRFSRKGDVERAWKFVLQSDGVQQTNFLARRYCQEAVRHVSRLRPSPERDALVALTHMVLTRDK